MNSDLHLASSTTTSPCDGCAGECLACCFNDAIVFEPGLGYRVVEENCAGCGACIPACEYELIHVARGVASIRQQLAVACAG